VQAKVCPQCGETSVGLAPAGASLVSDLL